MFDIVRADLNRKAEWYGLPSSFKSRLRMWFSDGSTAQILFRAMRFCQTHSLKPIAFFLYRFNAMVGHVIIGRGAQIGPGFVIVHSFGIVINSSVKAGKNLVIEHGVTIGAEKDQSPEIGDNVFIGAGAKIIGAVRVGSDVKIGANAVVVKDLPDGATAVGIPARVVRIYGNRVAEAGGGESSWTLEKQAPTSVGA
jgi:serine O-acetyltransferase